MATRVPAYDGKKDYDGRPLMVLADGICMKSGYTVNYLTSKDSITCYQGIKEWKKYFIKETRSRKGDGIADLTREKFLLDALDHPGVEKAYEIFEESGYYYLVLEHIDGTSLGRLVSPTGGIFLRESIINEWALQLFSILEYLHDQDPPLIYRELSPHKIFKDRGGRLHLVDFSRAFFLNERGAQKQRGPVSFITAAPEHFSGATIDVRTDIYTLGATLHFLLTNGYGRKGNDSIYPSVKSINPSVSPQVDSVIMKALEREPEKRFQSVKEMHEAYLLVDKPLLMDKPSRRTEVEKKPDNLLESLADRTAVPSEAVTGKKKELRGQIVGFSAFCMMALVVIAMSFLKKDPGSPVNASPTPALSSRATRKPPMSAILYPSQAPSPPKPRVSPARKVTPVKPVVAVRPASPPQPTRKPSAVRKTSVVPTALPPGSDISYPVAHPARTLRPIQGGHTSEPVRLPSAGGQKMPLTVMEKREILARAFGTGENSFLEPRGMASGRGIRFSSPSGYSISIPEGYLQTREDYSICSPTMKEMMRETYSFANAGPERSENSVRLLALSVFNVPLDTPTNTLYYIYFDELKRFPIQNLEMKHTTGPCGEPAYAIKFEYRPPFLNKNQKYGQFVYTGSSKDRLFVISANASFEYNGPLTQEMGDFMDSFQL